MGLGPQQGGAQVLLLHFQLFQLGDFHSPPQDVIRVNQG